MGKVDVLMSEIMNGPKAVSLIDVNVIPMNENRILEHQTIIIERKIINKIGNVNEVQIPEASYRIDCKDMYVIPGLIDMHVHLNVVMFFKDKYENLLYLANGVTSVRNMSGYHLWNYHPVLYAKRDIERGKKVGPNIYSSGMVIEGRPRSWPSSKVIDDIRKVRKFVKNEKQMGYDFIKIYPSLSEDVYYEIMKASREMNIPVVGHVPQKSGLKGALLAGQYSIEHLTGYVDPFDSKYKYEVPEAEMDEYIRNTKEAGVWNCPTLVVWENLVRKNKIHDLESDIRMKYISPKMKKFYRKSIHHMSYLIEKHGFKYPGENLDQLFSTINKLHDAGAGILLGTDAPNNYIMPGFSIHKELKNLVHAGLSPYEAIKSGTRDASYFLGKLREFGTIEEGKRADILLLRNNPLDDIEHTKDIEGVIINGLWISKSNIENILCAISDLYESN